MPSRQKLWDKWMTMPDTECAFELSRPLETIGQHGLGVGVSQEAMEFLMTNMMLFIGTRMMREWERTALMPQRAVIDVTVSVG